MKTLKIGINGMGRIGRTITRALTLRHLEGKDLNIQLVAANNPGDWSVLTHLLKYDSLHGQLKTEIKLENDILTIGNTKVKMFATKDPSEIPWGDLGVDIVIDSTGVFKNKAGLGKHLRDSVKKVIMCAPGEGLDGTFVMGINHENYDHSKHHIVSNASCTTNCLSPIAKVLHEKFDIINGFMTTVHAYTSDQNLLDNFHSDLRRARAAAMSMIPTSTGAAKALGEVMPSMAGKLDGYAIRVPTPDVSVVNLTVNVKNTASIDEVNKAMKEASEGYLKGILGYTSEKLVSIDFMGRTESSVFDSKLTNVIGNNINVVSWYDNEVGFSNRVLDLANYMGSKF